MIKKYPDFSILFFYVASTILLLFIQIFIMVFFPSIIETEDSELLFYAITSFLWYAVLFILYIYVYKAFFKNILIDFIKNYPRIIRQVFIGIFVMIAAAIISGIILMALVVDDTPQNQEVINSMFEAGNFERFSIVLTSMFFAPIIEEFVFRKSLFELFKVLPAPLIIFISSLAFGAIHVIGDDIAQIIYYFALGLGLGSMYYFTKKNYTVVVLMHFFVNSLVTYFMFTS